MEEGAPFSMTAAGGATCRACRQPIDAGDPFCRWCGRRQAPGANGWVYRPAVIMTLALTALGPLALPLVWRSPHLSRGGKWFYGAVIVLYTALLLAVCLWLAQVLWTQIQSILDASQGQF